MKFLFRLLPRRLRLAIKRKLHDAVRPEMIWGYDSPFHRRYLPHVRISSSAFLYHPEQIDFADDVFVWHYTILDGSGGLKIGNGTQIGAWVGVFTHSSHIAIRILGHNYRYVEEYEKPGFVFAPVSIGDFVFVAAGSKILPGVTIGSNSLISALSVVTRDIPPHSIVAGNPAKVVGDTKEMDRKAIAKLSEEQIALLDPEYLYMLGEEARIAARVNAAP